MEQLSRKNRTYPTYPERVIQFGEGNFLRAFVDYMIDSANEKGIFNSSVVIVKPIEFGNLNRFEKQDCLYTLSHRGVQNGEKIEDYRIISSVSRALDPYTQYEEYLACAGNPELRFVVSNTTEAGIAYDAEDRLELKPPKSYPGKLTQFLYARYQAFNGDSSKGLIMLPVELIERNGDNLKKCVLKQIENWNLPEDFKKWVLECNVFANTLVDRIVTGYPKGEGEGNAICEKMGYLDELLDTAEPFALWVIESDRDISGDFPLDQAGMKIIFTDNMKPYRDRKVRILNGAHTSMVLAAFLAGKNYVLECMEDEEIYSFMSKCMFDEIIPTLTLPEEELKAFAASVIERFKNPFIKHALLSISLNSVSKWKARVLPSFEGYVELNHKLPEHLTFSLAALMAFYQGTELRGGALIGNRNSEEYQILDDAAVLSFFAEYTQKLRSGEIDTVGFAKEFLSKTEFWGKDLNCYEGFAEAVGKDLSEIFETSMRAMLSKLSK